MVCDHFYKCLDNAPENLKNNCKKCRLDCAYRRISCEENKRKYILNNDLGYRVIKLRIDGGVIYNEENFKRCDWLYFVHDDKLKKTVFFIELKGKDIYHALEQLYETATFYKEGFINCRIFFRVVCSSAPRIENNSNIINLKKKIIKEFNSTPIIKVNKLEEKYSSLPK